MLITAISNPSGIIENIPSAKIDLTVTISVIIALCAIISPVLTAIINNRHNYRIRKMELDYDSQKERFQIHYQNKVRAFEGFLQSAKENRIAPSDTYEELLASANAAKLFCENSDSISDIDEFIRLITIRQYSNTEQLAEINKYKHALEDIAETLNKELLSSVFSHPVDHDK